MSRPKGSKNKPKTGLNEAKAACKRLRELTPTITPGFTAEMAKKGVLLSRIEDFCAKKGFPPSELIEKFEGLERRIKYYAESKMELEQTYGETVEELVNLKAKLNLEAPTELIDAYAGQNKPHPAPQTGKSGKTTQKEEKGKEGAQRGLEIEYEGEPLSEDEVRQIAENAKKHKPKGEMPAGLSKADTLKWLRNNK